MESHIVKTARHTPNKQIMTPSKKRERLPGRASRFPLVRLAKAKRGYRIAEIPESHAGHCNEYMRASLIATMRLVVHLLERCSQWGERAKGLRCGSQDGLLNHCRVS
eukprot:scaffold22122_cov31-Tisochrysis_lutea.AAC.1